MFSCDEAMLLRAQSYVIAGSKLYYCGLKAILLWAQSYIIVGSKLCFQCCNAIEKDRLLRSE